MKPRSSIAIFSAVIKALFLRELGMRMSIGKTGLFWTFFEPFAQVGVFILIRISVMGRGESAPYNFAVFMAIGFIAFNMFKKILSASTGAFTANKGLFAYKQVKPIDTIIARILVEMFMTAIIILLFLCVGFLLQYELTPENLVLIVAGYLWLVVFSFSVGLVAGIGNTFYVSVAKTIAIISFPLMIFSAVFYPLESIPPEAQQLLLYNPLVHFMEMIHAAYIFELDDHFVDYIYMLKWTITPLFIGMWLYLRLEKKIISS